MDRILASPESPDFDDETQPDSLPPTLTEEEEPLIENSQELLENQPGEGDEEKNEPVSDVEEEEDQLKQRYHYDVFGSDSDDDENGAPQQLDDKDSEASDYEDLEQSGKGQLAKLVKNKSKRKRKLSDDTDKPSKKRAKSDTGEPKPKKAPKPKKTPAKSKRSEQEIQEIVLNFMDTMRTAFEDDVDLNNLRKPATNKLKILDNVRLHMLNAEFQPVMIKNGALYEIARWLTPGEDKALPNIRIREELLNVLNQIRMEYIDSSLLQDSNVGRMVYLYSIHPKETNENKKLANQLLNKWLRPIYANDAYSVPYQSSESSPRTQRKQNAAGSSKSRLGAFDIQSVDDDDEDDDAQYRFHAKIPQSRSFEFIRNPRSDVSGAKPQTDVKRKLASILKKK